MCQRGFYVKFFQLERKKVTLTGGWNVIVTRHARLSHQ